MGTQCTLSEPEAGPPPTDEQILDGILGVIRNETLRYLRDQPQTFAAGDLKGDALRATILSRLVRLQRK